MEQVANFLRIWNDAIGVLLTTILVFLTGLYAWLTYRMVKASEKSVAVMARQLEETNRPYVTVAPFSNNHVFYLSIRNAGKTSARDLRLTLDRDFYRLGRRETNLRDLRIFRQPTASLAPDQAITILLAAGPQLLGEQRSELTPSAFSILATYSWSGGQAEESHHIDLGSYDNTNPRPDPVVDQLKNIGEAVQSVANRVDRLGQRETA